MSILDTFRRDRGIVAAATHVTAGLVDPSTLPISSPWTSSTLQRIVFEDIFGSDVPVNTRSAAMKLGPISRGRNLLVTTIARNPLRAYRVNEPLPKQPSWMTGSSDGTSPQHRLAWTVDDLIFYGWSCWWRDNAADGFPGDVRRLNQDEWTVNADNRVEVNGQVVENDQVILIPGLHEGILSYGVDVLRDARDLYANVRRRIANPVPNLELHQTGGDELTDDEIDDMKTEWAAARTGANGGVAFTNEFIQLIEHGGGDDTALMIESRNAAAVELARILGISAGRIDATTPKASLNYETTTGRNQELVDFDLQLYMLPITARLSMDDVTPHGTRIDFDLTDTYALTPSPSGPALED